MSRFRKNPFRMAARHLVVGLTLAFIGPALAHHSVSNFDQQKMLQITGVVAYVSFTNPHSYFDIDVKGDNGAEKYKVFATSKVALLRYGWRPNSVKVGDMISIEGWPDRTNPHYLYMLKIHFADGTDWSRDEIPK